MQHRTNLVARGDKRGTVGIGVCLRLPHSGVECVRKTVPQKSRQLGITPFPAIYQLSQPRLDRRRHERTVLNWGPHSWQGSSGRHRWLARVPMVAIRVRNEWWKRSRHDYCRSVDLLGGSRAIGLEKTANDEQRKLNASSPFMVKGKGLSWMLWLHERT